MDGFEEFFGEMPADLAAALDGAEPEASDAPVDDRGEEAAEPIDLDADEAPARQLKGELNPDELSRVRSEASEHRKARQELEARLEVFGAAEDREVWENLARAWANDPVEAAKWMRDIAGNVLGDDTPAEEESTYDPLVEREPGLTRADVEKLLAERDAATQKAQAERAAVNDITKALTDAGYDTTGQEARWILTHAVDGGGRPIAESIAAFEAWQQTIVDRYRDGKVRDSNNVVTAPAGQPGEAEMEFEDPDDYFKAGNQWLAEQNRRR